MAPLRWFITGASAGFGHALSLHVLQAGHSVAATVRGRTKSSEVVKLLEAAGAKIVELDVTDAAAVSKSIEAAEAALGGNVEVLVNNAGYSLLGAMEDLLDDENQKQFDTNFFGPLRLIRTVLPGMRAAKAGTIVNVSSVAGQDGLPSCSLYAASKFALEGLSESLAREVEPFGISVLIVEPGMFRTNFLSAVQINKTGVGDVYKTGPVQAVLNKFDTHIGKQPGDPAKGAAAIFEVVTGEGTAGHLKGKVLRLPLGADCTERIEAKLKSVEHDVEATREVAKNTSF